MITTHEIIYVLYKMLFNPNSFKEWIETVSALIFIITTINVCIIIPVIFNFFVIPNIEKRYCKKLKYAKDIYQLYPKFLYKNVDIATYIVACCSIFAGKILNRKRDYSRYALYEINYTKENATKFEIIMSFFSIINLFLAGIALLIFGIFQ